MSAVASSLSARTLSVHLSIRPETNASLTVQDVRHFLDRELAWSPIPGSCRFPRDDRGRGRGRVEELEASVLGVVGVDESIRLFEQAT